MYHAQTHIVHRSLARPALFFTSTLALSGSAAISRPKSTSCTLVYNAAANTLAKPSAADLLQQAGGKCVLVYLVVHLDAVAPGGGLVEALRLARRQQEGEADRAAGARRQAERGAAREQARQRAQSRSCRAHRPRQSMYRPSQKTQTDQLSLCVVSPRSVPPLRWLLCHARRSQAAKGFTVSGSSVWSVEFHRLRPSAAAAAAAAGATAAPKFSQRPGEGVGESLNRSVSSASCSICWSAEGGAVGDK